MTVDAQCYADSDCMLECLDQKIRKARKPHRCGECGIPINKGDQYEFATGLNESEGCWLSFHTCLPCTALRSEIFEPGTGVIFEAIEELLSDLLSEEPTDELRRQAELYRERRALARKERRPE